MVADGSCVVKIGASQTLNLVLPVSVVALL